MEEVRFTLININGPTTDQPKLFEWIKEWIITFFENENFVICGYFDLVEDPT